MFKAEGEEGILCFKYFLLCGIYIRVVIKETLQGPVPVRNAVIGKLTKPRKILYVVINVSRYRHTTNCICSYARVCWVCDR